MMSYVQYFSRQRDRAVRPEVPAIREVKAMHEYKLFCEDTSVTMAKLIREAAEEGFMVRDFQVMRAPEHAEKPYFFVALMVKTGATP